MNIYIKYINYIFGRMGVCKANIDLKDLFGEKENLDFNKIKDSIFIAPNNVAFLKKPIREGIIPQILLEFLCSRIMIKRSSKLVFLLNKSMRKFLKKI